MLWVTIPLWDNAGLYVLIAVLAFSVVYIGFRILLGLLPGS